MAEETTKQIQARNKALSEKIALMEREHQVQKELDKARANNKTDLQREIELYTEKTRTYRQLNEQVTAYIESAKIEAELLGEVRTEEELLELARQQAIKELKELETQKEKDGKLDEEKAKNLKIIIDAFEDGSISAKQFQKDLKRLGEESAGIRKAKQAAEDLGDEFDKSAQSILGIDKNWNQSGLTGRMLDAFNKGSDLTDVFASMGSKLKDTLSPTNLLGSAITKLVSASIELTKQLDRSFAEFKQTTGGGDEYMGVLSDVTGQNYAFGISSDEAMQSVSALYTELALFTSLSKEAQTEIADVSAKLQVMGVSAQDTAKTADLLMQSVGYTKDEFVGFQQSLKSMSNAIKVPMSVLNSQFVEAADVIGKYGKRGVEEFRKLAAAAKATGIEMRSLLDIAGQFDTFEDAAERVGQLNAILGGSYFDTVQMVNATEEERIDLLRRGVQASGKTFDQLGRYEKKAIAAAAGINDINEANKLFGESTVAYEELQQLAGDASMSLADLSDEAFNTLSPMQKLQAVFKKFQKPLDIVLKLIDLIGTALFNVVDAWEKFAAGIGITGEGFTYLNGTILLVLFSFKKLWGVFGLGGKLVGAMSKKMPILGKLFGSTSKKAGGFAKTLGAIGRAASRNAKGFLALGAAAMMLGAGVALAAIGFGELVKSFKDLSGGEIVGAILAITIVLAGFIVAILALGAAAGASALPMLGLGAALLMLGGGIAIAAYGISLLVDSISGLVATFASIPLENLFGLIGAVTTLATLGIFAGIGLLAIAAGITAIGVSLIAITDKEIDLLTKLFTSIGSVKMEAASAVDDMADSLGKLTGVEIPVEFKGVTDLLDAVSVVNPESGQAASGVIKQAAKLAATKADTNTNELIEALTKLVKSPSDKPKGSHWLLDQASGTGGTNNQKPFEIIVNIDGKKAWKGVRPYYVRELEGR